jgi:uncharacterized protein (DUF4415 family)
LTKTENDGLTEFERGLLTSVAQMQRGEFAAVHTSEQIEARRRGRPLGSTKANPKVPTSIRLSPDVLAAFRANGPGWQTRVDAALQDWLKTHAPA